MMAPTYVSSHHPLPRQPGSAADVGPFLNVVTWVLLITSALAVLTRLITKRALRRRIDVDDAFVVLALVCLANTSSNAHMCFAVLMKTMNRSRVSVLEFRSVCRQEMVLVTKTSRC